MEASERAAHFDVYGLRIRVEGDWPEVLEAVRLDFRWFETDRPASAPGVSIHVKKGEPDFAGAQVGSLTPTGVFYQLGWHQVGDYFGSAVSVLDADGRHLSVEGQRSAIVHELAYRFIRRQIGNHLNRKRLTRIHALGLSGAQGAVALLLPAGGGKSTMAVWAIRDDAVKLYSEDTPILDLRGRLHPFPLRIGVDQAATHLLPPGPLRSVDFRGVRPKFAIEVDSFRHRVETRPRSLRHIVIGRRSLLDEAILEPLPRLRGSRPLWREGVLPPKVREQAHVVWERGVGYGVGKGRLMGTRVACCAVALARAKVWQLTLGRDLDRNWAALCRLLK
jgi:hypothetical protein